MDEFSKLSPRILKKLGQINGPILIFGAGGFIGFNLFKSLILYRKDIFGISREPKTNWRLKTLQFEKKNLIQNDINNYSQTSSLINKIKPQTIFNLAAYGGNSNQQDYNKIYNSNLNSTVNILETLKKNKFTKYIHAGSSSEYGLNCKAPKEKSELTPNSHYAVSKISAYYLLKYYGKVENLPVVHTRLYSAYGPWEEWDRLIPTLVIRARNKEYPDLVDPEISRDFIYVRDVIDALILLAAINEKKINGEVFNIGTGRKITIRKLTQITGEIFKIDKKAKFRNYPNRSWDLKNWYSNPKKIERLGFRSKTNLKEGLQKTAKWQEKYAKS